MITAPFRVPKVRFRIVRDENGRAIMVVSDAAVPTGKVALLRTTVDAVAEDPAVREIWI
jgi:hypothetical protein